jgi:hypothetical protein
MSDLGTISFKAAHNRGQAILLIPLSMLIPGIILISGTTVVFFLLHSIGLNPDPVVFIILGLVLLISYGFIFNAKPWRKFGQLHKPKRLVLANALLYEKPVGRLKPLLGKVTINTRKRGEQTRHSVEDQIHLAEIIWFKMGKDNFGAYLLEDSRGELHVIWLFECEGISYSLTPEQYNAAAGYLQAALMDFSLTGSKETITFDACVRSSCVNEVAAIETLSNSAPTAEDRFVCEWIKRRILDLTQKGKHSPRYLRLYCTTKLSDLHLQFDDEDLADKLMAWIEKKIPSLKSADSLEKELKELLTAAYHKQFKRYRRLITQAMRLKVTPPSWEKAWQWAWDEVNEGIAPTPNSLMILTPKGLYAKRSPTDARLIASILFQAGEVFTDKSFVYLPGRKEYVGAVVMVAPPNREWEPGERQTQLFYGSEAINDPLTVNTRVISQFSSVPPGQAEFWAQIRTKSENSIRLWNQKQDKKDVASEVYMEDAVDAERSLKKGSVILHCAWTALVYRKSKAELDDAIASLCDHAAFNGRIVNREVGYCDRLWLDAINLTSDRLLQPNTEYRVFCQHERRLRNEASAMVALAPVMKEVPVHNKGVQLISRLRSPIYLNPFAKKPHTNMVIFGAIGSGKSGLLQALGKNAKMQGGKVLIVDGTRGDGSGSFDAWTEFDGGSYFNPHRDSSNIFDGLDERTLQSVDLTDKESLDRWGMFTSFLQQALTDLSYKGSDVERREKFNDLHTNLTASFFEQETIRNARAHAFDYGVGTTAWQNMPTLQNYVRFMEFENLGSVAQTDYNRALLQEAKAVLSALLQRQVGRAISRPTTFDGNASLLVYALGGINDEQEMLPLAIATQGNVFVQTQKPGLKLLVMEEASVNLRFKSLATFAKGNWAQGRKLNLHCILVSQIIETLLNSIAGDDILKNSRVTVVGAIVEDAVKGISKARGISEEALWQCTESDFFPSPDEFARQFLLYCGGNYTFANYFPDFVSFGQLMNEGDEMELKNEFTRRYSDKYERYSKLAQHLRSQSIHGH